MEILKPVEYDASSGLSRSPSSPQKRRPLTFVGTARNQSVVGPVRSRTMPSMSAAARPPPLAMGPLRPQTPVGPSRLVSTVGLDRERTLNQRYGIRRRVVPPAQAYECRFCGRPVDLEQRRQGLFCCKESRRLNQLWKERCGLDPVRDLATELELMNLERGITPGSRSFGSAASLSPPTSPMPQSPASPFSNQPSYTLPREYVWPGIRPPCPSARAITFPGLPSNYNVRSSRICQPTFGTQNARYPERPETATCPCTGDDFKRMLAAAMAAARDPGLGSGTCPCDALLPGDERRPPCTCGVVPGAVAAERHLRPRSATQGRPPCGPGVCYPLPGEKRKLKDEPKEEKRKKSGLERQSSRHGKSVFRREWPVAVPYQLSDDMYVALGWTLIPDDEDYANVLTFKAHPRKPPFIWVNPIEHHRLGEGLVLDKYYDDGQPFALFYRDGGMDVFYPDGQHAVVLCASEEGALLEAFSQGGEDEDGQMQPQKLLGIFDSNGNGAVLDEEGNLRLYYTQDGGTMKETPSGLPACWRWPGAYALDAMREVTLADDYVMRQLKDMAAAQAAGDGPRRPIRLPLPRPQIEEKRRREHVRKVFARRKRHEAAVRNVDVVLSSIITTAVSTARTTPSSGVSTKRSRNAMRRKKRKYEMASSLVKQTVEEAIYGPLDVPEELLRLTPEAEIFRPSPLEIDRNRKRARAREREQELQRLLKMPVAPPKTIVMRMNYFLSLRLINRKWISLQMRPNNQRRFLRVRLGHHLEPGVVVRVEEVDSRTAKGPPPAAITLLQRNAAACDPSTRQHPHPPPPPTPPPPPPRHSIAVSTPSRVIYQ